MSRDFLEVCGGTLVYCHKCARYRAAGEVCKCRVDSTVEAQPMTEEELVLWYGQRYLNDGHMGAVEA